ncbi:MAG: hypothetical protein SPL13_05445 [Clostridia bacterium]|nr:hypothetical protein [Clostridia bacterium]
MSEWILSITGIVFLTVVLFAILPRGKTSLIIKSLVGIMTLIVLLKPVILLKNNSFDLNRIFSNNEINFQEGFLDYTLTKKSVLLEKNLKEYLNKEAEYCKAVKVMLSYNEDNEISTNYVKIYLISDANLSIPPHIVFSEMAVEYLSAYVIVNINDIEIYE